MNDAVTLSLDISLDHKSLGFNLIPKTKSKTYCQSLLYQNRNEIALKSW